ncbi:hypothetical protein Acr_16g0001140 [Actinidia rufa]|uniref:Retrotransposon gag domain-containing protein n=1 Tax=Actinidia rufa TaxID=165716 RepID=A0A7J0FZB2_9ERIC|nr:hypothetical protein Acr_16g0001140 [Actinidia rufa]
MHLHSRCLPRPSASSPLDNRAHPMANTSQTPDLEGLHREIHDIAKQMRVMNENNACLIQLLVATNLPPPVAPPIPKIEQSHRSHCLRDDHSQNHSTGRGRRGRRQLPSPRRERSSSLSESKSSGQNPKVEGEEVRRRGRSPRHNNQGSSDEVMCKAFSATFKGSARSWFRKLAPGTIDSFRDLSRLFVANFMSYRVRQKNASHLFTIHQKELISILPRRSWSKPNEGGREGMTRERIQKLDEQTNGMRRGIISQTGNQGDKPTIDAFVPHLALPSWYCLPSTLPSPKDYFQLKEQIADLIKKGCLRKYVVDRLPPNLPEGRYGANRPNSGDIQVIHGGFKLGGCSSSSRKRHAKNASRRADEEIYNISSSAVDILPPITFSNDDLKAFDKMKIGMDKLYPFHTPLVRFGGNMTHPLGWIKLPVTLGMEPYQTTVWQVFMVVDCPSPYNAILDCPTLGGTRAITSTYHLKMKFPTSIGVGEITDDEMEALRDEVEQITFADPRKIKNTKPLEEVAPISIHSDYPDRHIMIGTELANKLRSALTNFLKINFDIFAWSQGDVPGIDPQIDTSGVSSQPKHWDRRLSFSGKRRPDMDE